jgi:phospholipid/cholesterol/gamma-HCH transport system ATP-binding protein
MEQNPHIAVKDLTIGFGNFIVQQDLNFSINRGEIFVIMGGSGCGKSTLLKVMNGLKSPQKGNVTINNQEMWPADNHSNHELFRYSGTLFQSGALWSDMTLAENIALSLKQYTDISADMINEVAAYKLMLVGLSGFDDYYPNEISGGMKKRAGLARAMALDPEILYCDEPSAGLDPLSAKRLDELILQLRDSLGTTIVIVTHELASIFAIADNAVFLDAQSKTQLTVGNPKQLRNNDSNPFVREFLNRGEGVSEYE